MPDELDDIVDNLREPSAWFRIIFMVGFALVLYLIMAPIIAVLLIVQALFSVITGESNRNLRQLGKALSIYIKQIIDFLTYNSNLRPFPFADFPNLDADDEPDESVESSTAAAAEANKPAARSSAASATKKAASKKPATKKAPARKAPSRKKAGQATDEDSASGNTEDEKIDKKSESSGSD